jgi:hypothetical protein
MEREERIEKLEGYKRLIARWKETKDPEVRSRINQETVWVRREVVEARCYGRLTIGPPPAIGGLVMRDVDAFESLFDPPYGRSLSSVVIDMVDRTIGVLRAGPPAPSKEEPSSVRVELDIHEGYAFIAMPMVPDDTDLIDVLDAIKEAAGRCGLNAERVDEPQSNERITDRILESIRKAEYVIVDLTGSKPNVFYEAGYAHGIGKIPIYIARHGTKLEFDLKDYPVIFFKGMKELKDALEKRQRGLAEGGKVGPGRPAWRRP